MQPRGSAELAQGAGTLLCNHSSSGQAHFASARLLTDASSHCRLWQLQRPAGALQRGSALQSSLLQRRPCAAPQLLLLLQSCCPACPSAQWASRAPMRPPLLL